MTQRPWNGTPARTQKNQTHHCSRQRRGAVGSGIAALNGELWELRWRLLHAASVPLLLARAEDLSPPR